MNDKAASVSELEDALATFELLDAPGHLLRRNHQRSYDIFCRIVGDDVTRQQIAVLVALAKHPGASQRDLVQGTGMDKSTLKEMLGRLVEKGWIARERHAADSRAWTMRITEAGGQVLLDRLPKVRAAQEEILAPLSERDRGALIHFLRVLAGVEQPSPPEEEDATACHQVRRDSPR